MCKYYKAVAYLYPRSSSSLLSETSETYIEIQIFDEMTTRTLVATPTKAALTPYKRPSKRKLREEAALQEARVKEARSRIIVTGAFIPETSGGKDVPRPDRGKGRTLADPPPPFDENSRYLQSNEISPYFAWTEKLDLDRASLPWWVRVPTRPNITHFEYMKQTRSVARTTKLLNEALRTMQTPENRRTKEMNMGLLPALSEYEQSMHGNGEKGKWELPRSTHETYDKLVVLLSQGAPEFLRPPPRSEREIKKYPFGRFKKVVVKKLPPLEMPLKWEPIYLSDWEEHMSWGPKEVLESLSSSGLGEERKQKVREMMKGIE